MITDVTAAVTGVETEKPTSALTMQGPGGILGKDEFLKLLIAQMRHQDPLSPMKGEELAVQLAQFSTVEQLIDLNATMGKQEEMQLAIVEALNGSSAIAAIGKTVVGIGNEIVIPEEGDLPSIDIVVGGAGGGATLRIFDENGKEVGTRELGFLLPGRQTVSLDDATDDLSPGIYSFSVEVVDGDEKAVPVQTFMSGVVDGVRYGSSGPVLTSGPFEFPIGGIIEIYAGSAPSQENTES